MKTTLESIGNKADQMEEGISDLEYRNLEMIQVEGERELRLFKSEETLGELSDSIKRANIRLMGIPEGKEGGREII